jgi:HTH-type transcriptional regulator, cell division transcriptional repressor
MTTFGDRFRTARKALCLTQMQMAEGLNISQAQIARIERGDSDTTSEVLARVHNLYGISPTWLITGKGQMREEAVA